MGFLRKLTGADAAEKGAQAQERAAQAGIDEQRAAREQQVALLQPYNQAGQQAINPLVAAITQGEYRKNPLIDQLSNDVTRRIFANQAARGRLGAGDTAGLLAAALAPIQLGDQQQQIQNLFGLTGMGQNAAAGQGAGVLNTANNIQEGLAQKGNAQAAFQNIRAKAQGDQFNFLTGGGFLGQTLGLNGGLTGQVSNVTGGAPSGINMTGGAQAGGQGGMAGVLSGLAAAFGLSDKNAKENIEKVAEMDNGLGIYKYNYKGSKRKQLGVLAQEVEKIKPHAVLEIGGMKHVNYGAI